MEGGKLAGLWYSLTRNYPTLWYALLGAVHSGHYLSVKTDAFSSRLVSESYHQAPGVRLQHNLTQSVPLDNFFSSVSSFAYSSECAEVPDQFSGSI